MLSFHHCSLLHHLAVTGIYIMAILRLLIYAATNPSCRNAAVSHILILLEADATALLEHMAGVVGRVGETLLALRGTRTV